MGRSRGNFHNVEDSTQRTGEKQIAGNVENFEFSSSMVQGTGRGGKYNCDYCQKDITGKIRIKCAWCLDFDLCVECMSVGVEINTHKRDHAYRVMQNLSFPLICPDWSADDEMLLLEGLEKYGMGNMTEVAEHVGTKSKEQCIEHYRNIYLNSPCFPLPDMSDVASRNKKGNTSGASGAVAPANFKKAKDVMSSKNRASIKIASDDDVQILETPPRDTKRKTIVKVDHPSSSKFKKPKTSEIATPSPQQPLDNTFSPAHHSKVLENLNTKVFPLDKVSLGEAESSNSLLHIQGDLLRAMSYLHHVGEKTATEQKLIEDLTRQCQQEKDKVLALKKEVKRLRVSVRNVEQDGMLALEREKDQLHEEVVQLKIAAESFPKEMETAVKGAKIVARWELMREWLKQQTSSWKPAAEFSQYRNIMETEAELKNLPLPSFEDEPEIPDEGCSSEAKD